MVPTPQLLEFIASSLDSSFHSCICISISIDTQHVTQVAKLIHCLQICTRTNIYTCDTCTGYQIWATSTNKWLHNFVHTTLCTATFLVYPPVMTCTLYWTRVWAIAQRDGRPAAYRWRPLFSATKFGWRPLLECLCHAVMLPRREARWNLVGCHKLLNRSQLLVGRSSVYCEDMWKRYCCLTSFFPIVDTCLNCEVSAWQSCVECSGAQMSIFCVIFFVLYFQSASCSTFQTCILKSH